jgi:hypothetical protein
MIKNFREQRLHWGGILPADEQRDQRSPQAPSATLYVMKPSPRALAATRRYL